MPPGYQKQRVAEFLRSLAANYAEQIRHFENGLVELCRELEIQEIVWSDLSLHNRPPASRFGEPHRPLADRTTFSIVWQGKSCFLGNGLPFRFFEKIARRPGRYCSHKDLLDDIWGQGQIRAKASIRNVVKRLRDKLTTDGMQELAEAIDGRVVGHYVLRLDRLK
ncbi:MAG TPA: helix-turn-helix domain-containing protein [Planctomicrobium sp.]|nr:helix-turn-helix domain-containing protein [Planctomicrobium sp.]